jgi:hypothetical protein
VLFVFVALLLLLLHSRGRLCLLMSGRMRRSGTVARDVAASHLGMSASTTAVRRLRRASTPMSLRLGLCEGSNERDNRQR